MAPTTFKALNFDASFQYSLCFEQVERMTIAPESKSPANEVGRYFPQRRLHRILYGRLNQAGRVMPLRACERC